MNKPNEDSKSPPSLPQRPSISKTHTSPATIITEPKSSDLQIKKKKDINKMDGMKEYYTHIDEHVTEVRRRKPNSPIAPELSDFQSRKGEIMSTQWITFIEAWIKYIINTAAYDDAERPLEPFSLRTVKHDMDRLYPMLAPLVKIAKRVRYVYRWENKILTGGIASFYLLLWYYDMVLAAVCIWLTLGIIWVRLDMFAQYGVDVLEEQPENDATVKSLNQNFWRKMKSTMLTQSPYGFTVFDDIPLAEWRNDIYTKYGPMVQLILSDTIDYLERIKNLFTWKRPAKTRILLVIIASSSFFLSIIPIRFVAKIVFLYVGFEFFVLQALRSYYPRYRRLFNILNLLLWDVPNDAEYALEVIRLSCEGEGEGEGTGKVKDNTTHSSGDRKTTKTRGDKSSSASMSDLSENSTKPILNEAATSTATTFAMLAAAAAVNKVKKTVDNRSKKKKKETEELVPPDDDPNCFGCMYKGSIPGRIYLRGNGFIFQTSRMTGSKVLVECAFRDIVGVKKTKQYDMFVLRSQGIDISIADGMVLKFENVLRRDDCFNRLVSASGKDGGEWKKMH
ncbi:MAG: hypothetical protein EXX96DRAFT_535650 [Benjaminiella poitrasii]|nr:MAG: hypothetical protein EXX96DRAFT_535650 [Benjaminiella poitrasii]